MNFTRARAGALVGLLGLAASAAFVACGGDDTTGTPTTDAGGKDSPTADTNPPIDSSPPPDTGSDGPDTSTLYTRLGGHQGLVNFVGAVIVELEKDPEEASYFVLNAPTPYPGRPAVADIIECFADLSGSAIGGPEVYPAKTPSGYQCRSLQESHQGIMPDGGPGTATDINFHIPNGLFTKFIAVASGVAKKAGVADADIAKVGALLGTTHDQIVGADAGDGGPFNALPYCDASDTRLGCYPVADGSSDAPNDG
jgi:hypothetical protein